MNSTACQAKKAVKPSAVTSEMISMIHLVRPSNRSISRPTRIMSPDLKV